VPKTFKARLIAAGLALLGSSMLRTQMRHALERIATTNPGRQE
jgi:hypothetical protein